MTAPSVAFTSPGDGQVLVSTPVTVSASAQDNAGGVGMASVEFSARRAISGATSSLGVVISSPYSVQWAPECNGIFVLSAVAKDACNNTSPASERTVTVTVLLLLPCL